MLARWQGRWAGKFQSLKIKHLCQDLLKSIPVLPHGHCQAKTTARAFSQASLTLVFPLISPPILFPRATVLKSEFNHGNHLLPSKTDRHPHSLEDQIQSLPHSIGEPPRSRRAFWAHPLAPPTRCPTRHNPLYTPGWSMPPRFRTCVSLCLENT